MISAVSLDVLASAASFATAAEEPPHPIRLIAIVEANVNITARAPSIGDGPWACRE